MINVERVADANALAFLHIDLDRGLAAIPDPTLS
jgi:hypothetical protein